MTGAVGESSQLSQNHQTLIYRDRHVRTTPIQEHFRGRISDGQLQYTIIIKLLLD